MRLRKRIGACRLLLRRYNSDHYRQSLHRRHSDEPTHPLPTPPPTLLSPFSLSLSYPPSPLLQPFCGDGVTPCGLGDALPRARASGGNGGAKRQWALVVWRSNTSGRSPNVEGVFAKRLTYQYTEEQNNHFWQFTIECSTSPLTLISLLSITSLLPFTVLILPLFLSTSSLCVRLSNNFLS